MNAQQVLIDADYLYRKFITVCDSKTQREILTKKVAPSKQRRGAGDDDD
jgi:hypothetical protein